MDYDSDSDEGLGIICYLMETRFVHFQKMEAQMKIRCLQVKDLKRQLSVFLNRLQFLSEKLPLKLSEVGASYWWSGKVRL